MANTISKYFEYAQLAQASYAWFFSGGSRKDELTAASKGNFTDKQADQFLSQYTLVSHLPNTLSGFSASVFKSASGEYTLAIRGTEVDLAGIITDWGTANIADIGFNGIAVKQAIDLMNYYQLLTAVAGQPLVQYQYVDGPGVPGLPGYSISAGSITYTTSTATETGVLAGKHFSVTGHSLGGHLALIMSRLAPGMVDAVYTYNAPGFDTGIVGGSNHTEWFFDTLRQNQTEATGQPSPILAGFDLSKIANLFVKDDIIENIGSVPGAKLEQFDEASGIVSAHSIVGMTDSLALQSLFAKLDPVLAISKISDILKAASADPAKSLEITLDKLRTLFEQNYVYGNVHYNAVPTMDGGSVYSRNDFYTNLYTLLDKIDTLPFTTFSIVSLTEKSASQIVQLAQIDPAYRYALIKLNPFVVTGASVLYDTINGEEELDLYDSSTGQGELTELYLKDRAAMLLWLNKINTEDIEGTTEGDGAEVFALPSTGTTYLFWDKADNTRIHLGNDAPSRRITFGDESAESLDGTSTHDHLYGGAGDDTLTGNKGYDHLEGGQGFDTYVLNPGDGYDTVLDTDGSGVIKFGSISALGSNGIDPKKWIHTTGSDSWADQQNGITYTRSIVDGETRLLIHKGDANVLVKGWSDGELGIALGEGTALAAPTGATITGDNDEEYFGASIYTRGDTASIYDAKNSAGEELGDKPATELYGAAADNTFVTGGGRDIVHAGAGNDTLYADSAISDLAAYIEAANLAAGTGQLGDWLYGAEGDDTLVGGSGDDGLAGGEGTDLIIGGAGADSIFGDQHIWASGFEWTYYLTPPSGNPWGTWQHQPTLGGLTNPSLADSGDDVVYAGSGDDRIWGNRGNDILLGESGNDEISGEENDDTVIGGEGDDTLPTLKGGLTAYRFEFADGSRMSAAEFIDSYADGPVSSYGDAGNQPWKQAA